MVNLGTAALVHKAEVTARPTVTRRQVDLAGQIIPTHIRRHLLASERSAPAPKLVRCSLDIHLPGADEFVTCVIEATPWDRYSVGDGAEEPHIDIESATADGAPLELSEDVRIVLEEAVAGYLDWDEVAR